MIPGFQPAGDAASRDAIRHALDENLIVEASAGTGKTSELVQRIARVLATGTARIDQIVAVTFTHKAAGELKIRLRQQLDMARAASVDAQEKAHLEAALTRLEEASIGTIHGFCAQILRERPVEAGIDPQFEELNDAEAARLFERAFQRWFQESLERGIPGLRRALSRLAWRDDWDDSPPMEQLRFAGRRLLEWRDFPAPWQRPDFVREAAIDDLVGMVREIRELMRECRNPGDPLFISLRPVQELAVSIERAEAERPRDYDTLEALMLKLARDLNKDVRKGRGGFAPGVSRDQVLEARGRLSAELGHFRAASDAHFASELREEMQTLIEDYTHSKRRAGKLDFLDLLLLARDLVRNNRQVRMHLQQRYRRIFVDEFQDTDPLQAELLLLLAAENPEETDWLKARPAPGKLFLVGDPKQSIYKFRRADVSLYQKLCEALAMHGVRRLSLLTSYRAVRPIQQMVNAAFADEMTGDASCAQATYSPLEEHCPAPERQPSIIVLPVPQPYSEHHRVTKGAIKASLPPAVGAFLDWMLGDSGWMVRDPSCPENWVPPIRQRPGGRQPRLCPRIGSARHPSSFGGFAFVPSARRGGNAARRVVRGGVARR
jgi:ATP-dependent helicase/nuclease subunit A